MATTMKRLKTIAADPSGNATLYFVLFAFFVFLFLYFFIL